MLAAQHGHSITARLLVARPELEINRKNIEVCFCAHDYTAIELACINGHSHTVGELLKHPKIDLNLPVGVGFWLIMTSLSQSSDSNIHCIDDK